MTLSVEALERLMGTVIKTKITTADDDGDVPVGDEEDTGMFHLIEMANIRRKNGAEGRILWVEIEISEWIFNSIRRKKVLTLHRDYFRLRKLIERRIYEIARKFCGYQDSWPISLDKLLSRTGARTELKRFRHTVREIARYDHLPDYSVSYDEEKDQVIFTNRGSVAVAPLPVWSGRLDPDAIMIREPLHPAGTCTCSRRNGAPGWARTRLS